MSMKVINPATGQEVRSFEPHATAQVDEALTRAVTAFASWKERPFDARASVLRRAAAILRERKNEWARLMAEEMGKPLAEGRGEAEKCAWVSEYYAEHAERFLAREPIETDASRSFVAFRPLGVVLAVMPWNFPFWQVFRFVAPALMAGNGAVLKHASNVPGAALAIARIFEEAELPDGLFSTLLLPSSGVADVIADRRIAAVTLTGSTPAGRAVASAAGRALKKTVLELGGSDPYVILADANVERAAELCARSRLLNGGQSCIAAKRFIVVPEAREAFERALVREMGKAIMGNPVDERTTLGPLARADLRDELHRQVERSQAAGARLLLGGQIPRGAGAFYPATVLTAVPEGSPAATEELFGPVAAVLPAKDERDALRIANDSAFGLGAAVFTRDVERGERIAETRLEAGCCFVNDFVRSDPRLPFGGVKESGYGRELGSFGIREFVNTKTVYVG